MCATTRRRKITTRIFCTCSWCMDNQRIWFLFTLDQSHISSERRSFVFRQNISQLATIARLRAQNMEEDGNGFAETAVKMFLVILRLLWRFRTFTTASTSFGELNKRRTEMFGKLLQVIQKIFLYWCLDMIYRNYLNSVTPLNYATG